MSENKNIFLKNIEEENNYKLTKNGAKTHSSTLDANLDIFAQNLRAYDDEKIASMFIKAFSEDKNLAIKNLLHIMDIRGGKGERKATKSILNFLTTFSGITREELENVLSLVSELGRWDYVIDMVKIESVRDFIITLMNHGAYDLLMYKWMPSTRGARKDVAKILQEKLELDERTYRRNLTTYRAKLNLIETLLTEKRYDEIDFSKIPSKAMLKYRNAFNSKAKENFDSYLEKVSNGEAKINANNLMAYEIIEKIQNNYSMDLTELNLLDQMWKNQKDVINGEHSAIAVVDTSGSMTGRPLNTSLGLGLYFAERNKRDWKDKLITFSSDPHFVTLPQGRIDEKLKVIPSINDNTNINKVFQLIYDVAISSPEAKADMPEHIVIISDMEFDSATSTYSYGYGNTANVTNFEWAKKLFEDVGLKLPKIIFWNASENYDQSMPVVKDTENVSMVSGFSNNVFENLFSLGELTPQKQMIKSLSKYDEYLV